MAASERATETWSPTVISTPYCSAASHSASISSGGASPNFDLVLLQDPFQLAVETEFVPAFAHYHPALLWAP